MPYPSSQVVLLDRDGTINLDKNYLSRPEELELYPGAATGLRKLKDQGFRLVVVTNQSAIGRGWMSLADLELVHERLRQLLRAEEVELDGIYFCPHTPNEECECRKPRPGMILQASKELGFSPSEAIMIGDKPCDIELGKNAGSTTILVRTGYGEQSTKEPNLQPDFIARDLSEAAEWILSDTTSTRGIARIP